MKKKTCLLILISSLLLTFSACASSPTPSAKPTPPPATKPAPPQPGKVMVVETKILEREITEWAKPTGKFERWKVTLNWYIWEADKVIVNVKVINIMQEKALVAPDLSAVDSIGNYGDVSLEVLKDEYGTPINIWPGQEVVGSKAFQFGPQSKGVKLYVHFFMESKGERVEFSLGR